MTTALRRAFAAAMFLVHPPVWAAKVAQVEPNHMRFENHETVLGHAIAWQQELSGHWVTVVLLTDRPVPTESIGPGASIDDAVLAAKAQGIAFAVMTGGVPLVDEGFKVWYLDGADLRSPTVTGSGGFEIENQTATQIKGRATLNAFGAKGADKSERAWLVTFDTKVLLGDAKRMQAEGEALGATGGQPGTDLLTALQAKRAMDYGTLSQYAAPDLVAFLAEPAARPKNLKMLQGMTSPQSHTIGGLRQGDKAQVYWVQVWPDALDNRCLDDLILEGGRWRSVASACAPE
jgi:hypothetical protein